MTTYEFTHNPDADIPSMDGLWRDPAQDQRENPATSHSPNVELEINAKEADERKKKKQSFIVRAFTKARNASNKFTSSPVTQKVAKRFSRASNILCAATLLTSFSMVAEGGTDLQTDDFRNASEYAPTTSIAPVARP